MPTLPIKLIGGSYESRSKPLSAQRTLNMYPELVPDGLSPSALLCWPGSKAFSEGDGKNRGIMRHPWNGNVYAVCGESLVKISSGKVRSTVGDIPGSARCVFAASASYVYVITEGKVYRTTGSGVSEVTDSDLESPNSGAFINSQMIYDGDAGRFVVSDAGDGGSISSLNFATAEAVPDDLVMVYTFGELALMFGERSIQPYYNSGSGSPPFDPIQNGLIHIGIAGVFAASNTMSHVYFLGNDKMPYRLDGYTAVDVADPAVANAFEGYEVSDCFVECVKIQGQNFVIYTFPTANKTWAFAERYQTWFELSTGKDYGRHIMNGYCYAFGKHLITDYRNGDILEFDLNTYSVNGETLPYERVLAPAFSDQAGLYDKPIFWNSIKLVINSGNGLNTGQGSDPQVMMSYSDDGGLTWSAELWESAGQLGQYQWEVEWYGLGVAVNRIFRFRVTDPIEFHMFKLFGDVEPGI